MRISRKFFVRGPLLSLPVALVLLIFFAWPIWNLFALSVQGSDSLGAPTGLTLEHYWKFLGDEYYLAILWRTLAISTVVSLLSIFLGYPVGYYIAAQKNGKMQAILMFCVVAPLMVSLVVRSYGWVVILGPTGIINSFLMDYKLVETPIALMYNEFGIALGLLNILLPFMILAVNGSLVRIEPSLLLAAADLGASPGRVFVNVTLPLSMPGIVAGTIVVFTLASSLFAAPAILGGSRARLMSYVAYEQALELVNWPFGAAVAFILFGIVYSITLILQRLTEAGWMKVAR